MSKRRLTGAILLLALTAMALLGPLFVREDPNRQHLEGVLAPASSQCPLGRDALGRSVLSRLVHGAGESLLLAIICVSASVTLGVCLGICAGVRRGFGDILIMRLTDGLMAFPGILLALVVAGILGGGRWTLVIALVCTGWTDYCRIARNLTRRVLAEDYVQAARLMGFDGIYLARRYLLRELAPHFFNLASLGMGRTILNLSAFGFLGIGLTPPSAEWGAMISQGLPYLEEAPRLVLIPGAAIFLAVMGCNLLSETKAAKDG